MFSKSIINGSGIILLLRTIIGIIFFAHGSQKVLGWFGGRGMDQMVEMWSQNMGISPFLTYAASYAEFLGGIFILLGLFTRLFTIGIMVNMLVAIFMVHLSNGFFNPSGFEFPLTLFTISLVIFLYGPGKFSFDELLEEQTRKSKKTNIAYNKEIYVE